MIGHVWHIILQEETKGGHAVTKHFFTPQEFLPAGAGFALFGKMHFCWLAISLALGALLCAVYKRCGARGRCRLRILTGSLILLCELLKTGNLYLHGAFTIYYLPLHLCGLAVFFSFYHALHPTRTVYNLLYSTCMPGALFAILFPDWTAYPAFSYHSIVGFTVHTLLVAYPLMQALGGDERPSVRYLPRCLAILAALALPIYAFDCAFNANYMFLLEPAAGSPLEWFAHLLGVPGYLLGYIPMIILVWSILYFPFRKNHDCIRPLK